MAYCGDLHRVVLVVIRVFENVASLLHLHERVRCTESEDIAHKVWISCC